jgi:hypothetical protein
MDFTMAGFALMKSMADVPKQILLKNSCQHSRAFG